MNSKLRRKVKQRVYCRDDAANVARSGAKTVCHFEAAVVDSNVRRINLSICVHPRIAVNNNKNNLNLRHNRSIIIKA